MQDLAQDLRYALRGLTRSPGFAAVAVLTLALGVGANTAIFSVVNGVLLRPLGYAEPEQLVSISTQFPTLGFDRFWMSPPEFMELREWNRSFASVGGYRTGQASVGGDAEPVRVTSAIATADVFTTLGVPAALGRTYSADEDLPGAAPVSVLSWELWQSGFGGDPDVVGRTVRVNGVEREIVGVMPAGFDIDDAGVQLWSPAELDPANRENRGSHFLNIVGRVHADVPLERARAELDELMLRWQDEFGGTHAPNPETHRVIVEPLQDRLVGGVRTALLVLLGAVGFVLLIACANVANLLLARAESRQKEISVRTALGAGRRRLLRQFLVEGGVLALIGGTVGLFLAWAGLRVLLAANPDSVPRAAVITLDASALAFTLGVSMLTGLLFGLAPALHLSPGAVSVSLREGGQRSTAAASRQRLRRLLVVSETALAVVLVVGAGLMLRSFANLLRVDPGFRAEGLVSFQLYLPAADYPDATSQVSFHQRLEQRLAGLPGVAGAATMSGLPPLRDVNANDMEFEGYVFTPGTGMAVPNADYWQFTTTDYLSTMEIGLVAGRGFSASDDGGAAPVVLINETLARVFYADQDPVGRRLRPGFGDYPWFTIVGVVRDVKQGGLDERTGTEAYFHVPQIGEYTNPPRAMNLVVRTTRPPLSMAGVIRQEVAALDASLPVANLRAMEEVLSSSVAQSRFLTLLLGLFAGLSLALAAVGTYGVMSYSVAERQQEIGIRMALGAGGPRVLRMVLGQGLAVAGIGLAIGVGGAFATSRLMSTMLFDVGATDAVAFLVAPAVLAAVAAFACWMPARRATRVDPATVLRRD